MVKGFTIASWSWLSLVGPVGALSSSCTPAQAQQFSADLIRTELHGRVASSAGKIRVFNDKVRIETPDFPDGFFLIDGVSRAAYFARPSERVFMDARQSSRLTQLFVPVGAADPCLQWQAMAQLAGAADRSDPWRCERVGEEAVGGRAVVIYRAISSPSRELLGWIDSNLKFRSASPHQAHQAERRVGRGAAAVMYLSRHNGSRRRIQLAELPWCVFRLWRPSRCAFPRHRSISASSTPGCFTIISRRPR